MADVMIGRERKGRSSDSSLFSSLVIMIVGERSYLFKFSYKENFFVLYFSLYSSVLPSIT